MPLDLLGSLNVTGTPLARPPHVASGANVGRFLEERWPIPLLPKGERDERGLSVFGGPSDFFQEGVVTAQRHSETIDEGLHNLFSDPLSGPVPEIFRADRPPVVPRAAGSHGVWEGQSRDVWSPAPVLALVRELLDRDQVAAARSLLAVVPDTENLDARRQLVRLRTVLSPPRIAKGQVSDRDRSREYRWLSLHRNDLRGRWVAVDGDELIAHAGSLRELREAIRHLARKPLIHRID